MAVAAGHHRGLLYLCDSITKRQFLVDTGAEVRVLPATRLETRMQHPGPSLTATNGSSIRTYGTRTLPLQFTSNKYRWKFIIADVTRPLLGADFLRSNSLLVDLKGKRLVDAATFHSVPLLLTTAPAPHFDAISRSTDQYDLLLAEFQDITMPNFVHSPTKHGAEHFIFTRGPPVHARARCLPPEKLAAAKSEFDRMEAMGIIRRSSSPWASPLHMVLKASGGWRPCGDYRRRRGRPVIQQTNQTIPVPSQPLYTRSGRQVKPTQRYISVLEGSGVADPTVRDTREHKTVLCNSIVYVNTNRDKTILCNSIVCA